MNTSATLQDRYTWLREQSSFFAARTQNLTEQEVNNLLSLDVGSPESLPNKNFPWVPLVDKNQSIHEAQVSLRQAKMAGIPYFLWWELGIHGDIEESARHLALWASGLLQSAFEMAEHLIIPRFGKLAEGEAEFAVIGLGKLEKT